MAQFNAVRLRGGDLVVVLQSDLVDYLPTRLVAPLLPIEQVPSIIPQLNPKIAIGGEEFILATHWRRRSQPGNSDVSKRCCPSMIMPSRRRSRC